MLAALIEQARSGRGRALVLRGEPGIGKTALLEYAAKHADCGSVRVLRAVGVEAEGELPFAALHQLLRPVAALIDDLPQPQRKALQTAFALGAPGDVDRFAVYVAAFTLLTTAAMEEPLLCALDDAHWLDDASAAALAFAARRVGHEPLALLFATRDSEPDPFAPAGVDVVEIGPLGAEEAKDLLAATRPTLSVSAAAAIARASRGNPLALVEFSAAGDEAHSYGEPLPVSAQVQRAFALRAEALSDAARRALLLAAVAHEGEHEAVRAALDGVGIPADALSEAENEGLLLPGAGIRFRHPLVRSAVYHAAPGERRAAHASIAATTTDPIARAWHLAEAATHPDADTADALDRAAVEAGRRGGASAEARALERSAFLTPDRDLRARRLYRAALAAESAGRANRAEELLIEAGDLMRDPSLACDIVTRRSYLLFDRGDFDRALELALDAADKASTPAAARILTGSGIVHALVHRLDLREAQRVAERAARVAGDDVSSDLDVCHMLAWTLELSGRTADALALVRECLPRVVPGSVVAIDFAIHLIYLEQYDDARRLLERLVAFERRTGGFGNLAYALDNLANLDLRTGRTVAAYANSVESAQLMETIGVDVGTAASLARLALIEAVMGIHAEAQEHAGRALEIAARRGDAWNEVRARAALGSEALARGDFAGASEFLEPAVRMLAAGEVHHPNMFRVHGDLIEALAGGGRPAEGELHLRRFARDAETTGSAWARAVAARCGAIFSDDANLDAAFDLALSHDGGDFERGRTLLAHGERLRRHRRRRDARGPLRLALELFEGSAASPWAERARAELRATGERLGPRPRPQDELTPQELRVALAAADGLTNNEIAARLFLSPKTVEAHLTRAYRKLAVRSRAQLVRVLADRADVVA
jgi:DNA-binding CsgD family transcriptional regulator